MVLYIHKLTVFTLFMPPPPTTSPTEEETKIKRLLDSERRQGSGMIGKLGSGKLGRGIKAATLSAMLYSQSMGGPGAAPKEPNRVDGVGGRNRSEEVMRSPSGPLPDLVAQPFAAAATAQQAALSQEEQQGLENEELEEVEQMQAAQQMNQLRLRQQVALEQVAMEESAQAESETTTAMPTAAKMGGLTFYALLGLSVVKDIVDFIGLGVAGTIVNIVVVCLFVLIILVQGAGALRDFIKKRKYILMLGAVAEFIPFVELLPVWTLAVLWARMETSKGGQVALQQVEKKYAPALKKTFGKLKK